MNMPAITQLTPLERLRLAGISPSRQRLMIATTLFEYGDHVTAQKLHHRVNRDFGPICRATIYNTLNLLVDKGLVRALAVETHLTYYDPHPHPHPHLYHEDSCELWDLEPVEVKLPALPARLEVTQVDMIVRVRSKDQQSPSDGTGD
ncbi:MAG: transcriptional repressor [Candidatus Competibacteraceae bacterium]|nr:transcriptional repressor [Candidatus Competibacteraceae bacterium]